MEVVVSLKNRLTHNSDKMPLYSEARTAFQEEHLLSGRSAHGLDHNPKEERDLDTSTTGRGLAVKDLHLGDKWRQFVDSNGR